MTTLEELVARMVRENWVNHEDESEMSELRADLLPFIQEAYELGRNETECQRVVAVKARNFWQKTCEEAAELIAEYDKALVNSLDKIKELEKKG